MGSGDGGPPPVSLPRLAARAARRAAAARARRRAPAQRARRGGGGIADRRRAARRGRRGARPAPLYRRLGAMIELIVNNLVRRIGRTLLTALGVGLGVATIVALLSVSDGLTQTAAGFVHLGGSDLGVFQSGVADPTESLLPIGLVSQVRRNPDIA